MLAPETRTVNHRGTNVWSKWWDVSDIPRRCWYPAFEGGPPVRHDGVSGEQGRSENASSPTAYVWNCKFPQLDLIAHACQVVRG